jgi:hypothetical protein
VREINGDLFSQLVNAQDASTMSALMDRHQVKADAENFYGMSLLSAVLLNHDLPKASSLVQRGADVSSLTFDGFTPMTRLAGESDDYCHELMFLSNAGARIDGTSIVLDESKTPLQCAVAACNIGHVKCLLKMGADIHKFTMDTDVPMIIATRKGDLECLQVLLDHGADVNHAMPISELTATSTALMCHPAMIDSIMPMFFAAGLDVNKICVWDSVFLDVVALESVKWARAILERGYKIMFDVPVPLRMDLVQALDMTQSAEVRDELNKLVGASGERLDIDLTMFKYPHPVIVNMDLARKEDPPTLKACVRTMLRHHLIRNKRGLNLLVQVQQLPLPPLIKQYLWFY